MILNFFRIKNFIFWISVVILIYITVSNIFVVVAKSTGVTQYGTQVGGRIASVSPIGCTLPPPAGPGLDPTCVAIGCTPSSPPVLNGVLITPYGYSATGICPLIVMQTTSGPIGVQSIGMQILGLFQTPVFPLAAVPLGLIGTSL